MRIGKSLDLKAPRNPSRLVQNSTHFLVSVRFSFFSLQIFLFNPEQILSVLCVFVYPVKFPAGISERISLGRFKLCFFPCLLSADGL